MAVVLFALLDVHGCWLNRTDEDPSSVKSSKPRAVLLANILWEPIGNDSLILAVTYCRLATAAVEAARNIEEPALFPPDEPNEPNEPHKGVV